MARCVGLCLLVALAASGAGKRSSKPEPELQQIAAKDLPVEYVAKTAKACGLRQQRDRVYALIQEERRYSEIAGVVNLYKLEHYKQTLQVIDASVDLVREDLTPTILALVKDGKTSAGCADPLVSRLVRCVPLYGERPPQCAATWVTDPPGECQAGDLIKYIRVFCT